MKRDKYMGMDVPQATTVVVVIDAEGTTQAEWLLSFFLQVGAVPSTAIGMRSVRRQR